SRPLRRPLSSRPTVACEARPQLRDLGSVFLVPRSLRCARKPPSVGMTEVASVGGFRLLLVVLRDVVVDAIRERELSVQVTGVWIVGILDDLEVLLGLPLQDALAPRRVVVSARHLVDQ